MRVQSLILSALAFVQYCIATEVVLNDAVVAFDSERPVVQLNNIDSKYDSKGVNIPVSLSETLKLSFVVDQELEQANVLVGLPSENLEAGYTLKKQSGSSNRFSLAIPLPKLAHAFNDRTELQVTLLVSTEEKSLVKKLFILSIVDPVTNTRDAAKNVVRLNPKEEIHHIFQSSPKTVNAFIAQLFALVIATTLFVLFVSWVSFGAVNFNLKNVSSYLFVALVSGFEFIFYKYYFGTSIFDTVFSAGLLFLPALLLGSATLKSLKH
ncbi:Swp1 [Kluyveromyces lactis]|nr:Swp1 [Kluyveromyces lactis]